MLFRTVYGQELQAIYETIAAHPQGLEKQLVYAQFISNQYQLCNLPTQNIDDALTFLLSSGIISEKNGSYYAYQTEIPFRLALLRNLRQIEQGVRPAMHPLDALFMALLDRVFVRPNALFQENLHIQANQLSWPLDVSGLNKEKIQAWKRVMEYLGLGYRHHNGFIFTMSPTLLEQMFIHSHLHEAALQQWLEEVLSAYVPYSSQSGDLSLGLQSTMLRLAQRGVICLKALQDSPHRAYFGARAYRWLSYGGAHAAQ
jgi:hypothetical protein